MICKELYKKNTTCEITYENHTFLYFQYLLHSLNTWKNQSLQPELNKVIFI